MNKARSIGDDLSEFAGLRRWARWTFYEPPRNVGSTIT